MHSEAFGAFLLCRQLPLALFIPVLWPGSSSHTLARRVAAAVLFINSILSPTQRPLLLRAGAHHIAKPGGEAGSKSCRHYGQMVKK